MEGAVPVTAGASVPTVWLLRHGESTTNAGGISHTHADIALTERGIAQADAAAARVNRRPDLVVVSPFARARATAEPLLRRWPEATAEVWPIEEFSYLSPERCRDTTTEMRRPWAAAYWERADPQYVDGDGAESFAGFMQRLSAFRERLLALGEVFVVAVGHGQFFRACLWAEPRGFPATPEAMRAWRADEIARPMANGEILVWPLGAPAAPGLDIARALGFLAGDAETLRELLAVFMNDAPRELAAFRAALDGGMQAREAALKYLHRLVPTLAIIATEALHGEARDLYHTLIGDGAAPLAPMLPRLSALAARMDALLAETRAQLSR